MGRKLILKRGRSLLSSFTLSTTRVYSVLPAISNSYPHLKGRLPTCSSPVRHSRRRASSPLAVRLACLRRAASVRSEPGSNSPLFYFKHPERCLIFINNVEVFPFLLFQGTLTFCKSLKLKKAFANTSFISYTFPYQSFYTLACFSSFPSLLFQRPTAAKHLLCFAARENI